MLGLAPETFWSMTPSEFRALVSGRLRALGEAARPAVAASRAELEEMMARFPD